MSVLVTLVLTIVLSRRGVLSILAGGPTSLHIARSRPLEHNTPKASEPKDHRNLSPPIPE